MFFQFMTDGFFAQATIETVKLQVRSAKSPVYLYEIGRAGERTYAQPLLGTSKNNFYGEQYGKRWSDVANQFTETTLFASSSL